MFWEIFLKLCEEHNEKPNPLAKKLKISSGTVTNWKNGSEPQPMNLKKIADYFGVSVDYLLGKEEPDCSFDPTQKKSNPNTTELDDYEKKLIGTFRETTIDGKLRILNAADEIKKDIEKNNTESDSTFA